MNRLIIDDIELTDCVTDGLEDISLEYGFFDRTYGFTTSSEITLCKEGYELIYDKFFSDCQIDSVCKVQLYKGCCDEWFELDIEAKDVEICPGECLSTIKLTKIPDARKCVNKLCRTFIGDLGYKDVATRHCVYYSIDRGLLQRFLMVLLPILSLFSWIISIWVINFTIICRWFNFIVSGGIIGNLLGFNVIDCPEIPEIKTIPCELSKFVTGSGQFHVGVKYKEVFEYYADQCGLEFKSTIFDHPDYRSMGTIFSTNTAGQDGFGRDLINAVFNDGTEKKVIWYQENVPAKSIKDILDDLADNVFNAEWIIKDGCLYFDTKEVIDGLRSELFNLADIIERVSSKPCYSYVDNPGLAALRFKYCPDSINYLGDEMRHLFEGTKDFNEEDADWKTEVEEIQSNCHSGNMRGMFDRKLLTQSQGVRWDVALDKLRCGDTSGYFNDILIGGLTQYFTGLIGLLSSFLICDLTRKCDIILSGDITECQPLLIFDEDSPLEDTTIQKRQTGLDVDGYPIYEYNYSLSFVQQNDDDSFTCGQLYNEFWANKDPNTQGGREILQMTDLKWSPTCDEQIAIHENPCGWYLSLGDGSRVNIDVIGIDCQQEQIEGSIEIGLIKC